MWNIYFSYYLNTGWVKKLDLFERW